MQQNQNGALGRGHNRLQGRYRLVKDSGVTSRRLHVPFVLTSPGGVRVSAVSVGTALAFDADPWRGHTDERICGFGLTGRCNIAGELRDALGDLLMNRWRPEMGRGPLTRGDGEGAAVRVGRPDLEEGAEHD